MASNYSTNLKIELIAAGEQAGTWGTTTNTNLGTALEEAIVGYGNPDFTSDADLTLTLSNSNATQVARNLVLNVTSSASLTATRNLVVPTIEKPYVVQNNTTGGQSIVVKTSGGSGVTIPNGLSAFVYADGTDVVSAINYTPTLTSGSLTLTSALPVASGGTGSASLTANNVLLGNGTSAVQEVAPGTDGNFLVSDGTTWTTEDGATARTSLGLGSIATQDSNSVSITGGSVTGITDLAVADGGTGASTADGALTNLLPSQSGESGKYLTTDGTNTSWGDPTPTTAQVLAATAGASVGAVGTYALLRIRNTNLSPGGTVASSSNSRYANASGGESSLTSGTWRCMGTIYTGGTADDQVTLFLRIA